MKTRLLLAGLLTVGVFCLSIQAKENKNSKDTKKDGSWISDFAKAKSDAAAKKRPICALFTGSDWCPWCIKLESEILSSEEFKSFAEKELVLFIADFPRQSKQSQKLAKQNQGLKETYKVSGFPTVVLMDADGKELGHTGYIDSDQKAFVERLKNMLIKK
jgi:thioredoxin-related protein